MDKRELVDLESTLAFMEHIKAQREAHIQRISDAFYAADERADQTPAPEPIREDPVYGIMMVICILGLAVSFIGLIGSLFSGSPT